MPRKLSKIIGRNVQRLRELKGCTQYHLACIAGIGQGTVSRIENGTLDLDLETAAHFARFFGCPVEDLLRQRRWADAPFDDGPASGPHG